MTLLFIILIIVACIILSLIVLVQNPKGGGLAGNIAGISNQFMGVKQTNDVLEKGTWIFAAIIGILCIISTLFIQGGNTVQHDRIRNVSTGPIPSTQQQAPPQNTVPLQQNNQNQAPKQNP
ncbi:MAG TPA: preprotein translocase subunit SecG [Flavisolibacter sp.]|nr:preprotein translocase subunit SecG [Flavisolibacter sp.]